MIFGGAIGVVFGLFVLFNINNALNKLDGRIETLEYELNDLKEEVRVSILDQLEDETRILDIENRLGKEGN